MAWCDTQLNDASEFSKELSFDSAFLAKSVFDLHCLIQKQSEELYLLKGLDFPVVVSSTIMFLSTVNKASITQIANALNHAHQLAAQRVKILLKHDLIKASPDLEDKRRTLYSLTEKGIEMAKALKLYCVDAAAAFDDLSNEMGVDLQQLFNKLSAALLQRSFGDRFDHSKASYLDQVRSQSNVKS